MKKISQSVGAALLLLFAACHSNPPALPSVDPSGVTRQAAGSLYRTQQVQSLRSTCLEQQQFIALLDKTLINKSKPHHAPLLDSNKQLQQVYAQWLASCPQGDALPNEAAYNQWRSDSEKLRKALQQCAENVNDALRSSLWSEFVASVGAWNLSAALPDFAELQKNGDTAQMLLSLRLAESEMLARVERYYRIGLEEISNIELKLDAFTVLNSCEKEVILLGEEFRSNLQLAAYANLSNVEFFVNDENIATKNGVGIYTTTAQGNGTMQFEVSVRLQNPLTGEVKSASRTLEMPVVPRAAAAIGNTPSVYVGVDNKLQVYPPKHRLQLSGAGSRIARTESNGDLILQASSAGEINLHLQAEDGKQLFSGKLIARPVPTPVATVGGQKGGNISASSLRAQKGIVAMLENFDYDARCEIVSYTLHHSPQGKASTALPAESALFEGAVQEAINSAKSGDLFVFHDIKARCPGDQSPRSLQSLPFVIK